MDFGAAQNMLQQLLQGSNAGYSDPAAAPVLNGDDGDNVIVGEDGGQRINGGDGADLLKHIEALDFDDRTVILDDTGDTPPGGGGGEGDPACETADHFYLELRQGDAEDNHICLDADVRALNNQLSGQNGADTLSVSGPTLISNILDGGSGADALSITSQPADTMVFGNFLMGAAGEDLITAHADAGHMLLNFLLGGDGDDTIGMTTDSGWIGPVFLQGGARNDTLYIDDGTDGIVRGAELSGGAGDDLLLNLATNDASSGIELFGGSGDDTIHSGAGSDSIWLGAGADTLVHDVGDGTDYVFDFEAGSGDLLDFTGHGVASVDLAQVNSYAQLAFDGGEVNLMGVNANQLVAGIDYIF